MKNESNLKSKSEYMIALFSFLGIFMILTLVLTNFTSKGTYSASTCTCPSGYTLYGEKTCTKTTYSCPSGYTLSGTTCSKSTCTCSSGYTLNGTSCYKKTYSCPSGYTLSGTMCSKTTCTCPSGYRLSGTTCYYDAESEPATCSTNSVSATVGTDTKSATCNTDTKTAQSTTETKVADCSSSDNTPTPNSSETKACYCCNCTNGKYSCVSNGNKTFNTCSSTCNIPSWGSDKTGLPCGGSSGSTCYCNVCDSKTKTYTSSMGCDECTGVRTFGTTLAGQSCGSTDTPPPDATCDYTTASACKTAGAKCSCGYTGCSSANSKGCYTYTCKSCDSGSDGTTTKKTTTGVISCYKCEASSSNVQYIKASSVETAASVAKVTSDKCSKVDSKYCGDDSSSGGSDTPSTNPQTGTTAVVIAWLIGLSAIGYSIWYFKRVGSIK